MYVVLEENDVVLHEKEIGDTTWRLVSDAMEDNDIFMAIWRKPDYPEGCWAIFWRGLWDKAREKYEGIVLDMYVDDAGLWEGMPSSEKDAMARVNDHYEDKRSNIDHSDHDHPSTPQARAKCRKELAERQAYFFGEV